MGEKREADQPGPSWLLCCLGSSRHCGRGLQLGCGSTGHQWAPTLHGAVGAGAGRTLLAAMVVAALAPGAGGLLFPSPGRAGGPVPLRSDGALSPAPGCPASCRQAPCPAGQVTRGQDATFLWQWACPLVGTRTAGARASLAQRAAVSVSAESELPSGVQGPHSTS